MCFFFFFWRLFSPLQTTTTTTIKQSSCAFVGGTAETRVVVRELQGKQATRPYCSENLTRGCWGLVHFYFSPLSCPLDSPSLSLSIYIRHTHTIIIIFLLSNLFRYTWVGLHESPKLLKHSHKNLFLF